MCVCVGAWVGGGGWGWEGEWWRGWWDAVPPPDFSTNVTDLAKAGLLDPLIGRYKEVERVTQILGRRRKNNAVLVGEPGVGKPGGPPR